MGTTVELLLESEDGAGARAAQDAAEREIRRVEARLSRFRPDSELSALNRRGRLRAGPELLAVTELALAARERTRGRFDPTVHDAVVAAGYDRSFELMAETGPGRAAGGAALRRSGARGPLGAWSSSVPACGSTWAASPKGGPSTGPRPSWAGPGRALSTPEATSPSPGRPGRSRGPWPWRCPTVP